MTAPVDPWLVLRQRAWDRAAQLAADGRPSDAVVAAVLDELEPQIDIASIRRVPARGRVFALSLAKSLAWGVAVDVLLLVFGPTSGGAVAAVRWTILIGVLVWAVAFGIFAANNKVRVQRVRAIMTIREVIATLAAEAARQVRASRSGGPPPATPA